jgi:hypothetical protein
MGEKTSPKLRVAREVISCFAMVVVGCAILILLLPFLVVDTVYVWCCWLIRKREAIFLYRAPLRTAGEPYRPADSAQAKERFNSLLDKYFERAEPDEHNEYYTIFKLNWKSTALPNAAWPKQFLKENGRSRRIRFMLTKHSISFSSIVFPIPLKEPASYDFLKQFSSETPFKMRVEYFSVAIPIGKNERYATRKPDAEMSVRLNEAISQ